MKTGTTEYLGDGVYASTDGNSVTLDLRAQDDSKIVLEPEVYEEFIRYADKVFGIHRRPLDSVDSLRKELREALELKELLENLEVLVVSLPAIIAKVPGDIP